MSGLTRLVKEVPEVIVDVRSALEDALDAMPDQKMPTGDIHNGLINRHVQDREIKMSNTDLILNNPDIKSISPKQVLKEIKETRADRYDVHEIKGIPDKRNTYVEKVIYDNSEWQSLLRAENVLDPTLDVNALTQNNIDSFIARQRELVEDMRINPGMHAQGPVEIEEVISYHENAIDTALTLRRNVEVTPRPSDDLLDTWSDLQEGDDVYGNLTVDNVTSYIDDLENNVDMYARASDEMDEHHRAMTAQKISDAEELRWNLQQELARRPHAGPYAEELKQWDELLANSPYEGKELTLNNVKRFIEDRQTAVNEAIAERDAGEYGTYSEEMINRFKLQRDDAEELYRTLETIEADINIDKIDQIAENYGLEGNLFDQPGVNADYEYAEDIFEDLDKYVKIVTERQGSQAAVDFEKEILESGYRSRNQLLKLHGFSGPDYDVGEYLDNIEPNDLDSIIEAIREDQSETVVSRFAREFDASRGEGTRVFASEGQPQLVEESMDAVLETAELFIEADTAFKRLADIYNIDAPDANNIAEVNAFLDNAKYLQANTPDVTDTTDIQPIQDSYNVLMRHIEAGDQTVTIPNYNTHLVDPNTTWTFPDKAYETYTLPDTDRGTYAVRIYRNPTVDTKEFPYEEISHWSNESYAKHGVFQVRGDYIAPGKRRLFEIQSDTQNEMTKMKDSLITHWRRGDLPLKDEVIDPRTLNEAAIAIRVDVNKAILDNIESRGIKPYRDDISEYYNEMSQRDIHESLVELLIPNEAKISGMSPRAQNFANTLLLNTDAPRMPPTLIKEFADYYDIPKEEVTKIAYLLEELPNMYKRQVDRFYIQHTNKIKDELALRVSHKDRIKRIKTGNSSIPEERELYRKAITKTFNHYNEKYGFNVSMKGGRIPSPTTVREGLTEQVIQKVIDHVSVMPTGTFRLYRSDIKREINNYTAKGREYIKTAFGDEFSLAELIEESHKVLNKNINAGVKDLPPLEKFPDADKYTLDIPWRKQAIQEEVIAAIKNGDKEVWLTVNPRGVEKLARADGVQPNYEGPDGDMYKTFKTVAKKFKADIVEEDGYLKMVLPTKDKLNPKVVAGGTVAAATIPVQLYAESNDTDATRRALEAGHSKEVIDAYKKKKSIEEDEEAFNYDKAIAAGHSPEVIKAYRQKQFAEAINAIPESDFAEQQGFTSDVPTIDGSQQYNKLTAETIRGIAIDLMVDPTTPTGMDMIYEEAMYRTNPGLREHNEKIAEDWLTDETRFIVSDLIENRDYDQFLNWGASKIGFGPMEEVYKKQKAEIATEIMELAEERGIKLIYGQGQTLEGVDGKKLVLEEDTWWIDINGKISSAEPGTLASLMRYGGEIGLSIGGAVAGGMWADQYTRSWNAGPYTALFKFGVITAATAAGAFIGDQYDYLSAAVRQHEEINWATAGHKAMGAAEAAVVGDVLLLGAGKAAYHTIWRPVRHAYNMVMNGNLDGGYEMLLRVADATPEQAKEIVTRWEKVNQRQAPTLADRRKWYNPRRLASTPKQVDKEKAIAILPTGFRGGEHIVPSVGEKNPRASAAIASEINQRAKSLVRSTSGEIDEAGKRVVAKEIIDSIGTYKSEVEDFYNIVKQQGGELQPKNYSWNMEHLGIQSLAEDLVSRIYPDAQRKSAMNMLKRLDKITTTRTFEDLIELRQLMNKIRGKKSLGAGDHEAFKNVIALIDDEIHSVSKRMGPGGEQWYKDWMRAKLDYSEMKKLTTNALGKVLTRPGISDVAVAKALVKYGTALDGTYDDLVKQLPLEVQPNVEALIIDELVTKFTDGNITQFQATNFPELSKALADYDFVWPRSRAIRDVVDQFAEIYQNDNALSYVSGGISTTKFQSYLTVDPVVRAQFEIASGFFNQVKVMMGGPKGDAAALIKIAAKLLEDPLNPHNVERALLAIEDESMLKTAIHKLSSETAATRQLGRPGGTMKIRTYKDKKGNLWTKPGEGRELIDGVPMHRITNEEVALKVARAQDVNDLSDAQKARLINAGFTHIGLEDGTVIVLN